MEFLVRMKLAFPPGLAEAEQAEVLEAEATQAQSLRSQGIINRIWRLPGRWANIGIWESPDATQLHEHITSLPLARHSDIDVTALAQHYLEQA